MAKAKAAKKAKPNPRNKKLYDDGMKMRKAVLGAGYVDNSMANAATDDFMMSFQDITTEYAWGYVWTRPGLPKKTRSMLNLAMLAALNRGPELKLHVNGALNNGLTKEGGDQGDLPAGRDLLRHPGQSRRLQDRKRRVQGTWRLTTNRHPDRSLAQRRVVEGPVHVLDKDQVPPLRFAPVGMTAVVSKGQFGGLRSIKPATSTDSTTLPA
jgi:4-carboxymuconolactone decarboxylase